VSIWSIQTSESASKQVRYTEAVSCVCLNECISACGPLKSGFIRVPFLRHGSLSLSLSINSSDNHLHRCTDVMQRCPDADYSCIFISPSVRPSVRIRRLLTNLLMTPCGVCTDSEIPSELPTDVKCRSVKARSHRSNSNELDSGLRPVQFS